MFDVITFGSASQDIYISSKKFFKIADKKFKEGEGVCFDLGSKIELENVEFFSGGGGTNTAATFSRQGLKAAYCGAVGDDYLGISMIKELENSGIGSFVKTVKEKKTNISFILSYPGQDKTVLVFRGASDSFDVKDIPWEKIKNAKWFYLAPFSGKLARLTEKIIDFAKKNNIKVAMNPGYSQLVMPDYELKRILGKIDVLILNQEEAALITKVDYKKEKEIFRKLDDIVPGICIMTKGKDGAVASDGKYFYSAGTFAKKINDNIGAGDAMGSGFVAEFIKTGDIVTAMQFGLANAAANLREAGAKEGLLKKGEEFRKIEVKKKLCGEKSACKIK
jgi:sugar/nucleoside kinase (ribokinase family)